MRSPPVSPTANDGVHLSVQDYLDDLNFETAAMIRVAKAESDEEAAQDDSDGDDAPVTRSATASRRAMFAQRQYGEGHKSSRSIIMDSSCKNYCQWWDADTYEQHTYKTREEVRR